MDKIDFCSLINEPSVSSKKKKKDKNIELNRKKAEES